MPAIVAYSLTLGGWVLSVLWGWFVVPVFGVPALAVSQAIGVTLVVHYLVLHVDTSKDRSLSEGLAIVTAKAAVFLLFGWAVKSCM